MSSVVNMNFHSIINANTGALQYHPYQLAFAVHLYFLHNLPSIFMEKYFYSFQAIKHNIFEAIFPMYQELIKDFFL